VLGSGAEAGPRAGSNNLLSFGLCTGSVLSGELFVSMEEEVWGWGGEGGGAHHWYLSEQAAPVLPYSLASCTVYMILLYFSLKGTIDFSILCSLYHILAAVR